jgi:hypothetical protein
MTDSNSLLTLAPPLASLLCLSISGGIRLMAAKLIVTEALETGQA